MNYLEQPTGGEGVDDAILQSLGIVNDGVRAHLLQYLTELGPLQCPEASDGYHRVSKDQGGKGEGKGSDDDYERDFCEEDGQDHYLDDFEYTVESAGSLSPLCVSWVGDGVDALTPRHFAAQHAQERPVDTEARMHRKSSSGTPPVDSPICSEATDEGSSSSHTTRPSALASPHLDSHASTPLTSPNQPSTTHDDHTAGMPLRRREKSTASDPRQVAEELNLRLKEDKHKEVSGGDFIYMCVWKGHSLIYIFKSNYIHGEGHIHGIKRMAYTYVEIEKVTSR